MTFIDTKYFGVYLNCSKKGFECLFGIHINFFNKDIEVLLAIGLIYISISIPRKKEMPE